MEQPAADYLRGFSKEVRDTFVEGDAIAKHALWLRDNRIVTSDHRFLIDGSKSELHTALTTNVGLRSAVCNWSTAYLQDPRKIEPHCGLLVRKHNGKLLVTARGMMTHWSAYTTNAHPPTAGQLEKAISGLSNGRKQLLTKDGKPTNYRIIDTENLISWADEHGFADRATILAALKVKSLEDNANGTE